MRTSPKIGWDRLQFLRAERPIKRVAVAVVAALFAIGFERVVWPIIPYDRGAVAVATLSVLIAAVFGGVWAGLLTTGLLALSIDNLWVPGHGGPADDAAWKRHGLAVLFVLIGMAMTWLAEWPRWLWESARGSEYRFRRLFEENPLGVALVGHDHRLAAANGALGRMFGYEPAELIGRTFDELTHPDDLSADVELFERVLTGEIHDYGLTKRYIRRDGEVFWGELHVAVVRNGRGQLDYVIGMVQDVTGRMGMQKSLERAKAEAETARDQAEAAKEAARGSENRFRRMFEQAPLGTTLGDRDYRLIGVNRMFCEMIGYTEEELIGRTVASLTYPQDVAEDVRLAGQMWAEETRGYTRTKRYVRKDGTVFWAAVSVAAIADEAGRQRYALGMIQDITDRKRMEESLERARTEAEAAQRHAEAARDQAEAAREAAEAASRAKDQFLAVLSHELRTPLSPVLLTASALETDPALPAAVRDGIRTIRQNAEMEARLIDDLLDVTGIARGKLILRREKVDVHALVGQAMYMVEGDVAAKRLRLRAELNAPCAELDADPTRLQQVFWNLLGNAVKFTPEGGEVTVRTSCERDEEGEWLVVEVRDTGEGIAADVLPRLFHAFEQGTSRTTRQFGGLGLGLTIARGIVELHGGRIEAGSEGLGRGSRFTVRLPRRRAGVAGGEPAAGAAPRGSVETAVPSRPSGAGDGRRLRILLVEDHPATRRAMAAILSSLGHEVRAAGSLAEGLSMAEAGDVDLVVSDLALPDGSGHDLMRSLKGRRRELHGLAVSGYGREDDIRRSREAGFDEHLTKPVSRERLREALSHVGA